MNSTNDEDRIVVYETLVEAREQFGENFDALVFRLTRKQAEALLNGKVVAFDIRGREHAGFLTLAEETSVKTMNGGQNEH